MKPSSIVTTLALAASAVTFSARAQDAKPYLLLEEGADPTAEGALKRVDPRRGADAVPVVLPNLTVRLFDVPTGLEEQGAEVVISRTQDPGAAILRAKFDFANAGYEFEPNAAPAGEFKLTACTPLDTRGFEPVEWTRCRVVRADGARPRVGFWSQDTFARVQEEIRKGLLFGGEVSLDLVVRERRVEPSRPTQATFAWKRAKEAAGDAEAHFGALFGRTRDVDGELGGIAFALAVGPHLIDPCSLLPLPDGLKRKGGLDAAECAKLPADPTARSVAYLKLRNQLARDAQEALLLEEGGGRVSLADKAGLSEMRVTVDTGLSPARTVIGEPRTRSVRYVPAIQFTRF